MSQTKWLYQLMGPQFRGDEISEEDAGIEPATRDDSEYLRLKIKKKHQNHLLRKMLEDGGYKDLAKMANIRGGQPVYSDPESGEEY
jgi:hypothetical protein